MRVVAVAQPLLACTDIAGEYCSLGYKDGSASATLTAGRSDAEALVFIARALSGDSAFTKAVSAQATNVAWQALPDVPAVLALTTEAGSLVSLGVEGVPPTSVATLLSAFAEALRNEDAVSVLDALVEDARTPRLTSADT